MRWLPLLVGGLTIVAAILALAAAIALGCEGESWLVIVAMVLTALLLAIGGCACCISRSSGGGGGDKPTKGTVVVA